MTTIAIPDDTYARLASRAAALNTTVEWLAASTLDRLTQETEGTNGHADSPTLPLTGEAWKQAFDAFNRDIQARADRYPPGFRLDDSREAMYADREDAQLSLTGEAWKQAFDAHMKAVETRADQYPPGFVCDVSRESIYEGCGE